VALKKDGFKEPTFTVERPLPPNKPLYWRVEVNGAVSKNGPFSFVLDPAIATSLQGTVVRAALAGNAQPSEGKLLQETGVAPSEEGKALFFDGKTAKVVYDAPQFPLRTYTFCAWFSPKDLGKDEKRWHHLCSAWCAAMNDPLRVSIQDGELVVNIEQPGGGGHLAGVPVKNDVWTHVAVVKNYGELILYVNGERIRSTAVPMSLQSGAKNLGIGCNPNYGELEGFKGSMAGVAFSREAWTDAQIQETFKKGR
jgi:hypothetical protein